jgi:predicted phage terminase large subunit-like protein
MLNMEREQQASLLRSSLLEFTRFFFKHITGRDFIISNPLSMESHHVTVCRELTKLSRLEIPSQRLMINLPPGYGKSVLVSMWTAWNIAQHPDSNFLYISFSHDLASKHTYFIKSIVSSPIFKHLFNVSIKVDSRAKDHFATEQGGIIRAFGSGGPVVGSDAGLPGLDRFSGAVVIDDAHKPDEVHSDAVRGNVIRNYQETISRRPRGVNVPIIFIGQRLHEEDLPAWLEDGNDTSAWDILKLKGLNDAGNALYPEVMPKDKLLALQEKSPYVFASQYQQNPIPSGGALFKPDWFVSLVEEPPMLSTFITADTAETSKSWNDATVFSFWGIYEIESFGRQTGTKGLHWIDCLEIRVEPKDLRDNFLEFWQACMLYPTPPTFAAIEKKSTGVTLSSVLSEMRGLQVRNIERTRASGSKAQRFLEIQPYIAEKLISFPAYGKHVQTCLEHMSKITANDTHRHDDICDTAADAIKIALIDKTLHTMHNKRTSATDVLSNLGTQMRRQNIARTRRDGVR